MAQELDLNAIIQTAVNAALSARSSGPRRRYGGGVRTKPTPEESEARRKANDEECIKVFKAAGYKTVEPRFNVLTYKKWLEKGRQVKKNENGHKVGPFNLFHEDQTEPLGATAEAISPAPKSPPPKEAPKPTPAPTPKVEPTKAAVPMGTATTQSWTDWNS